MPQARSSELFRWYVQELQVHVAVGGSALCCWIRLLTFIEIASLRLLRFLGAFKALVLHSRQKKVSGRSVSVSSLVQEMCSQVWHASHWIIGVPSLLVSKSCPQWQIFTGGVLCASGVGLFWAEIACWLFWLPFRRLCGLLCMMSIHSLKLCFCFSCRFLLFRRRVAGGTISASSLYLYHHCRARIGSMLFLFSHSWAKKVNSCRATFFVRLLYFRDPLRQFTLVWPSLRMIPCVPVGEVVHFHASRIALCQSLFWREKFFEGWLVSSVIKLSSWSVAAGQYFFFHSLKVLIAIRTSVLLEVFVAGVIPKTSPMGRWVVPFFFGIVVFGCGCMLMHLGGIVAIRVSLFCAISALVSSSSRTTPSVLST